MCMLVLELFSVLTNMKHNIRSGEKMMVSTSILFQYYGVH